MAGFERLFSEPNVRFEDDQVVWRALQANRGAAPMGEDRSTKGAGFADALIVLKALWAASAAGDALNAVYTVDEAMQRFPHTGNGRLSSEARYLQNGHYGGSSHSHSEATRRQTRRQTAQPLDLDRRTPE